jgi:hypothetical protein
LVEQGTENPRVGSSILSLATIKSIFKTTSYLFSFAQTGQGIKVPVTGKKSPALLGLSAWLYAIK